MITNPKARKNQKNIIKTSLPVSEFPDWIDVHFDTAQSEPPTDMPSPKKVIHFLEHMPIIKDSKFALKLTNTLRRILFFYQKSDTISRFERGKLMKERQKNSKKIKEWDRESDKLDRKINLGIKQVRKQDKEIIKLKEEIRRVVNNNLQYHDLLDIGDLEGVREIWRENSIRDKLMSKRNIFSNEDVQTKMSILELIDGLDKLMNKQINISNSEYFGNDSFLLSINQYIEKEHKDYHKYLTNVKDCLNQNRDILEIKNKCNCIERELQRAFREEQKVNYKQESLELKKEILSKMCLYIV